MPRLPLIAGLMRPAAYDHPVAATIEALETHISWVLLTGDFAYKVKKPVKLAFVDFSTLERRRRFCEDELRLNRRTAPQLYLDVVPITGSVEAPVMGGSGTPLEYAVKMRQFRTEDRLDHLVDSGQVSPAELSRFAEALIAFHDTADRLRSATFGSNAAVRRRLAANLTELEGALEAAVRPAVHVVRDWITGEIERRLVLIDARAETGAVRECHGDMHLRNLVRIGRRIVAFDCIEFDEALRWIDVIDDVAFVIMDLEVRGRADLASVLLDAYLRSGGDYAAIGLLRLYTVHRALVRAKVAALSPRDSAADASGIPAEVRQFLDYAQTSCRPPRPTMLLLHGLPASGKSSVASALVAALPGLRVSSDVERKRLAGLDRQQRSGSGIGTGLYTQSGNIATYGRLKLLSEAILDAGRDVIVDATFARRADRRDFIRLGQGVGAEVRVVRCEAPLPVLERRIVARSQTASDSEADLEVLRHAVRHHEAAGEAEGVPVIQVDTTDPLSADALMRLVHKIRS